MREGSGTLYIKIDQNCLVTLPKVTLSDVAKIECEDEALLRKVKQLEIYRFGQGKDSHKTIAMSILKVIQLIHGIKPGVLVVNEGEADFVIEYQESRNKNSFLDKVKTVAVCVLIFFGSAFSIMAFNNDIGITDMFDKFYLQVMGQESNGVNALEICYCLGLGVGITVFFNHVGSKKITHDPTPIQVSMRQYEKDIDTTFIENAGRKGHNVDVK